MDSGSVQFAIQCTTCKGRLVVRNEKAIGQILPCPKCGSMVMVTPPEGYEPPAATSATTPAASTPPSTQPKSPGASPVQGPAAKSPATAEGTSAVPPQGQKKVAGGRPLSPRAKAAQAMGGLSETVDDSAVLSQKDFAPPPTEMAGEESAAGPLLPSQAALPKGNWQKPLVWGGGGLAVLLLAVMVLGYLFSSDENPQTAQGPQEETQQPEDPPSAPAEETPLDPADEQPPATLPNEQPVDPPVDEPADNPDENPPGVSPPETEEDTPATPEDAPPLEIDDTPPTPPDTGLTDSFSEFEAFIDPTAGGDTLPPAETEEADADLTPQWADVPLRQRPSFVPVDVAARLQDPIAAISLKETPLEDLLRLVSGMTTIPVAIDPESLAAARVSLAAPITLELNDTTAGELLAAALAQHGLALLPAEGCAIIEKAAPPEGPRSIRYELDDLTSGDPNAFKRLVDMLRALAPAGTWSEDGGSATMEIEGETVIVAAGEPVHYQLGLFCEKLRLARDLPLRQAPLRPATLQTRQQLAAEKLATKLRLNFPEPIALRAILDRLEREAEVKILVDWQALIAFGWPSNSEATLTIDEGTLEEALYRLLAPMELDWRAVDADTLEITTQDMLAVRLELEIYPLTQEHLTGLEPSEVADHMAIELGLDHFRQGGGSGILWYDEPSNSLIALLPQPTQRELAKLLRNWQPFVGG